MQKFPIILASSFLSRSVPFCLVQYRNLSAIIGITTAYEEGKKGKNVNSSATTKKWITAQLKNNLADVMGREY